MDYADVVYQNSTASCSHSLDVAYNSLCRFILRCPYRTHHCLMYEQLSWLAPSNRRQYHWLQFIFKCVHYNYPNYLKQYLVPYHSQYSLRHSEQIYFVVPRVQREIGRYAFCVRAPHDWNSLPACIRSCTSLSSFKNTLLVQLQNICHCY